MYKYHQRISGNRKITEKSVCDFIIDGVYVYIFHGKWHAYVYVNIYNTYTHVYRQPCLSWFKHFVIPYAIQMVRFPIPIGSGDYRDIL